jgi:hypothetical protein
MDLTLRAWIEHRILLFGCIARSVYLALNDVGAVGSADRRLEIGPLLVVAFYCCIVISTPPGSPNHESASEDVNRFFLIYTIVVLTRWFRVDLERFVDWLQYGRG